MLYTSYVHIHFLLTVKITLFCKCKPKQAANEKLPRMTNDNAETTSNIHTIAR